MNCTQCGTEINSNAKFCHNCGTPIQAQNSKFLSDGLRGLKEIRGWVYIISNESMPGLLKIGYSTKDPELRAKEFNNAGLPHSYVVEYDVLLENPYYVEQETHKKLMQKNKNKEWFCCTVEEAIIAIKSVVGSTYIKESFKCINNLKLEDATKAKERLQEENIKCSVDQLISRVESDDIRVIKLLISAGVDINDQNAGRQKALEIAFDCNKIEILELLLAHGAKPGKYMVMEAINSSVRDSNKIKVLKLLLTYGADMDCFNPATPFTYVIYSDNPNSMEIVKLLLEYGVNIEEMGTVGQTALMAAVYNNRLDIAKLLLDHHANIEVDDGGGTLLMWAIITQKIEIAKFLLDHGANINTSSFGDTALKTAVRYGNVEAVKFLLANGAATCLKDDADDETPLSRAYSFDYTEIAQLLLAYGAKRCRKSF